MERTLPAGLVFVSLLLALYSVLSLIGCLYPPRDTESLFGAAVSVIVAGTAILILSNHKFALGSAFFAAATLTMVSALDYPLLRHFRFSNQALLQAAHLFLHVML